MYYNDEEFEWVSGEDSPKKKPKRPELFGDPTEDYELTLDELEDAEQYVEREGYRRKMSDE